MPLVGCWWFVRLVPVGMSEVWLVLAMPAGLLILILVPHAGDDIAASEYERGEVGTGEQGRDKTT